MSGILGPGRTVDQMLSAGGRRLQPALNRTVDLLGYGPSAVVRRLIKLIREEHDQTDMHRAWVGTLREDNRVEPSGAEGDLDPVLQALIDMVCFPCPVCENHLFSGPWVVGPKCHALLIRLLDYARSVTSIHPDIACAERAAVTTI